MKVIKADLLDVQLFGNEQKTEKIMIDDSEQATVRSFISYYLNKPIKDKPMTREIDHIIDKAQGALGGTDFITDDSVYDYVKKHMDAIGIINRFIYKPVMTAIDSATEYKPA